MQWWRVKQKRPVHDGGTPNDVQPQHVDEPCELIVEKRCGVLGFFRDDVSYKQVCDPPSAWRWGDAVAETPRRESA